MAPARLLSPAHDDVPHVRVNLHLATGAPTRPSRKETVQSASEPTKAISFTGADDDHSVNLRHMPPLPGSSTQQSSTQQSSIQQSGTQQSAPERPTKPVVFVLFGGTGDLAKRMVIPAFFTLAQEELLPEDYMLVGNGRGDVSHEDFRGHVHDVLTEFGPQPDDRALGRLQRPAAVRRRRVRLRRPRQPARRGHRGQAPTSARRRNWSTTSRCRRSPSPS